MLKALEKDRNRRYGRPPSSQPISRHLANEPVLAGPPSTLYRMRKFVARHRVALALVAGAVRRGASLFGALMAWQAREIALQRDEARFQAQRAEASSEFMSLMLEEVGPGGRPLTPLELLDKGVELLDSHTARIRVRGAHAAADVASLHGPRQHRQAGAGAGARGCDRARLGRPDLLAASNARRCGRSRRNQHEHAREHLEGARAALARLPRPPVATQVDCLRAEADIAEVARDFAEGRCQPAQVPQLLDRTGTPGLLYHAVLTDLGGILFRTGPVSGSAGAERTHGRGSRSQRPRRHARSRHGP